MNAVTTHANDNEVTILARVLGNEDGQLSREMAQHILTLGVAKVLRNCVCV